MISLASQQDRQQESERQETEQENDEEEIAVNPNIQMNFDHLAKQSISEEDEYDIKRGGKNGNGYEKRRRPSMDQLEGFEMAIPNNDQSRKNSHARGQSPPNLAKQLQNVDWQQRGSISSSRKNSYREQILATDEDAELKRAILQLIFVDDIQNLQSLLQLQNGENISLQGNDQFEFDLTKENSRRAIISKKMNENIRNLNWHDQHVKTNLDSKITPLTQAAYLGRKQIVEMMLEHYTYLDLNLSTKENGYTPISSACMAGNYEIVSLLAENGADVNEVDSSDQSPLIYCFSRLNEDENFYENKALALRMADVLLEHGADINQFAIGKTILMTFCSQDFIKMKKIQQMMLLEVVTYLLHHGADPYTLKCKKTGMSAMEIAVKNQQAAKQKKQKLIAAGKLSKNDDIENKVVETLLNTKQVYFHPQLKNYNIKNVPGNSSQSSKKSQYRGQYTKSSNQSQNQVLDSHSQDIFGCCGCSSLFSSICKQ